MPPSRQRTRKGGLDMTYPATPGGTRLFSEDWSDGRGRPGWRPGAVQIADRGLWWLEWRET
jgi:hypothetical protein